MPSHPVPQTSTRTGLAPAGELGHQLTRALGVALLVVGVAAAVVGGLVFGLGWLPGSALPYYMLGIGAALFAGMLALWLHGRLLDPRAAMPYAGDGRLMAGRMQSLLAAAFGVKLVVLTIGVFALRQSGAKFADTTTFAVTFAGGALLCQLATAAFLARTLRHRPGRPTAS